MQQTDVPLVNNPDPTNAPSQLTGEQKPAPNRSHLSLDDRENDLGRGLNRQSLRRLFGYLRPYKVQAAVALNGAKKRSK